MFKFIVRYFNRYTAWLRKDSRLLVRNGEGIIDGNKFYSIRMASFDPEQKTSNVIDKDTNVTNFPELTGCVGVSPSTDWIADIVEGIDSWVEMDVYARCQQVDSRGNNIGEAFLVSVFNPTIGCPYCIVQSSDGFYFSQSLYEGHSLGVILSDGRTMTVYRDSDTDVKEWKVDVEG